MNFNKQDIQLATAGGLLIGLATSIHYLMKGRITGFSGIYYSLISMDKGSFYWKLSLMSAVAFSSTIMYRTYGETPIIAGASPAFDSVQTLSKIGFAGAGIAGFLVGLGTKLGNGCTSGHGVCGLPRLSKRSFVAVGCFMGMGILTSTLKSYFVTESPSFTLPSPSSQQLSLMAAVLTGALIVYGNVMSFRQGKLMDSLIGTLVGSVMGTGLVVSGMVKRSKIQGFLTLNQDWDPSLMFVMLGAVGLNFITFRLLKKPILAEKYEIPSITAVDRKLVLGSSIFGVGWGLGGLCPGPAVALLSEFTPQIGFVFLPALAMGQFTAVRVAQFMDKQKYYQNCIKIELNEFIVNT